MKHPLLQAKNICSHVDQFLIDDISLDLFSGEVHVIMGENGSGKSLFMELINGTVYIDSGELWFNNKLLTQKTMSNFVSKQTIYIHQDALMYDHLTIAENLFFHNLPLKNSLFKIIDYEKLDFLFYQLLEELSLPKSFYDDVINLGLAQRQIMELCKAYISDAKIVILDEPSSLLNQAERKILYDIVLKIKAKGVGVFYITHLIDDVLAIGDRVSGFKKGKLIGTRTVAESTVEEILGLLSNDYVLPRFPKFIKKHGRILMSVRHLSYESKLHDINFDLKEGEILGITGMAGSGRSLLANCLFGVVKHEGHIFINGISAHIQSPHEAIAKGIAYLPENRRDDAIFPSLSVTENIAFPSYKRFARYRIIHNDFLNQSVHDYAKKINISTQSSPDISTYTDGHLQKVLFAKWMMNRAHIFILDEPTRGIDSATKIDVYNFVNDLVKNNVCVIYISSDIEEILGLCDRVAVLNNNTFSCNFATNETNIDEILKFSTSKK